MFFIQPPVFYFAAVSFWGFVYLACFSRLFQRLTTKRSLGNFGVGFYRLNKLLNTWCYRGGLTLSEKLMMCQLCLVYITKNKTIKERKQTKTIKPFVSFFLE